MRAFWLELKSICKSFKFLAFIILILAFQAMLYAQFQREYQRLWFVEQVNNNSYRSEMYGWTGFWERRIANPIRFSMPLEYIEYNLSWYIYEMNIAENIAEAYNNKDWEAYNRAQAERDLLHWNWHRSGIVNQQINPNRPVLPAHESYFGEEWESLKSLVDYRDDLIIAPFMSYQREFRVPEEIIFSAAYHLYLLREGLPPKGAQDTSAWGFTFNFFRRGLPIVLGVVVLLLTINLVHRDKKTGTIKTVLQMPRGRVFYLLRKVALGFCAGTLALLIPLTLVFIILGLKNGFSGLNFPVLVDSTFMDWKAPPDPVVFYRFKDYSPVYQVGLSQYQLSVIQNYVTIGRLNFIVLWKFMGLASLLVGLFIMLYSVLGVLISVLVKNELTAQGAAVAVFALGTGFGRIFPNLKNKPWDVFAKVNVIPILEGNHYTTYLTSLAVAGGVILLLFVLAYLGFRRQDITGEQA